jgi:glucosamine kinase
MSMRPGPHAGVDAGASKTLAVLVDEYGREVGRGLAGGANYHASGLQQAEAEFHKALDAALDNARQTLGECPPLVGLWIGMAGIDRPEDRDVWLPRLRGLADELRLTNDGELVLSGLRETVGVALIAGTGAIALGRDRRGAMARASGWGHILGDEGSGYDIGRSALQAAARAADGRGPETALLAAILEHWHLEAPSDLIGYVYAPADKADIADLSRLMFAAAQAGDTVARRIVARAAGEIALAGLTVAQRLELGEGPLPLALAGGLLVGVPSFRAAVVRRMRRRRALGQVVVVEEPALSAARAAAGRA